MIRFTNYFVVKNVKYIINDFTNVEIYTVQFEPLVNRGIYRLEGEAIYYDKT